MYKSISKNKNIIEILKVFLFFISIYVIFFAPTIFSDKLLAPGDGIVQSVPAFYSSRTLWTDLLYSGFPVAADPTVQHWYPISLFFSLIPNSWNYFVLSAYVMASCFTYGYVYKLTSSRFAAIFSGLAYGMSGFMMAHLGHTSMVHGSAWMPLEIWSWEELREKFTIQWFLVGVVAIACSILAGHPQISVYSLALTGFYVLASGGRAVIGRWRYYQLFLAATVLGIALGAIQIIPTAELSSLGLRPEMSFEDFNSFSLPPIEAIKLVFPYVLGASPAVPWLYDTPYFGSWNFTEMAGYAGLTTLILALVGSKCDKKTKSTQKITKFWLFTALISFLLTLGSVTPLAWIVYHLPVLKNFRVPARHFLELTFAFSVLAGIGLSGITKQLLNVKKLRQIITGAAGFFSILLLVIFLSQETIVDEIKDEVGQEAAQQFTLLPWSNPALGIPIIIFILAIISLIYLVKLPANKIVKSSVILLLILDLSSFGWFCEWRDYSPSQTLLTPTPRVQKYAQILRDTHQRILPIRGGKGSWEEIPANMSRLWSVPSATGYGPLILARLSKLLSLDTPGNIVAPEWDATSDRSLDILAVRYVFTPTDIASVSYDEGDNEYYPIAKNSIAQGNSSRWQQVENIDQTTVYENRRAQPRVWLVPEVVTLQAKDILNTIKTSNLPDGRIYEPSQLALIEEKIDFQIEQFDAQATVEFVKIDDETHLQIKARSDSPTFLVLSDINYPGWRAKIDGKPTPIYQTNYLLRGIVLPKGDLTVELVFKSTSLNLAVGITAAALLLCIYLLGFYRHKSS